MRAPAKGFTFIELMMTLAIMGVLLAMVIPVAQLSVKRQKERELRQALEEIRQAIDAYKSATEQGRILLKMDETGYPPSLTVLVEGISDQRSPSRRKIFFLRKVPRDPFADESIVQASETWGLRSYESPADKPVAGRDVYDVHSKSSVEGLNGVPYAKW